MELANPCTRRAITTATNQCIGTTRSRTVVLAAFDTHVQAAVTPFPLRSQVPSSNRYDASRPRQVQLVWQSSSKEQLRRLAREKEAARALMIEIKYCQTWQQLSRLYLHNAENMNHLHVSATITHLAQLLSRPGAQWSSTQPEAAHNQLSQSHGRDLSSSQSLEADMGRPSSDSNNVEHPSGRPSPQSQTRNLSSTGSSAGAYSTAVHTLQPSLSTLPDPRLLFFKASGWGWNEEAVPAAMHLLSRPPDITSIPSFMPHLLKTVMTHLPSYKGRQIANTVWALSKIHALGVYTPSRSVIIRLLQETMSPAPPSSTSVHSKNRKHTVEQPTTSTSTPAPAPSPTSSPLQTHTESLPGEPILTDFSSSQPAQQAFNPGRISDGLQRDKEQERERSNSSRFHDWASQARSDAGLPSAVLLGSLHNQNSLPSVMLGSAGSSGTGVSPTHQGPSLAREELEQLPTSTTQHPQSSPAHPSSPLQPHISSGQQESKQASPPALQSVPSTTSPAQQPWPQQQPSSITTSPSTVSSSNSPSHAVSTGTQQRASNSSSSRATQKLGGFQSQHLANTLYAIGMMGVIPPPLWIQACIEQVIQELPTFKPQEVSMTLYSLALIQQSCRTRSVIDTVSLEALLMAAESSFHLFKLQELVNVLWAASRLGTLANTRRMKDVSNTSAESDSSASLPKDTSNPVSTLRQAEAGHVNAFVPTPISAGQNAAASRAPSQSRDSASSLPQFSEAAFTHPGAILPTPAHPHRLPSSSWMSHLCEVAFPLLTEDRISHPIYAEDSYSPFARGSSPSPLSVQMGRELSYTGRTSSSSQAFNRASHLHSGANDFSSDQHSTSHHQASTSQNQFERSRVPPFATTALISSLGRLRFRPPIRSLQRLLAVLPPLETLEPQPLCDLLTGLVHMEYTPHPVWIRNAGRAVLGCLKRCTAQNLVMLLWALSHFKGSLDRTFYGPYLYSISRVMGDLKTTEVAILINSLVRVRVRPGPIWMERFCIEAEQHLPRMEPQSHAILMCALATLNHKPSVMWLSAVEEATLPALGNQHSTAGLSQLLYGFAVLGHRPRQEWREALQETLQRYLPNLLPQDFASLLWSLAMLDVRPPVRLLITLLSSLPELSQNMSSPSVNQTLWALARWQPLPEGPWHGVVASLHQQQVQVQLELEQAKLIGAAGVAARLARKDRISANRAAHASACLSDLVVADFRHSTLQLGPSQLQEAPTGDHDVDVESDLMGVGPAGMHRGKEDHSKVVLEGLVAWAAGRVNIAVGARS